jgi:CHAT domain-containing protein
MISSGGNGDRVTELFDRITTATETSRRAPAEARSELDDCIRDAARLATPEAEAQARYQLARVELTLGHPDRSLAEIERAGTCWRRAGNVVQAIRTNLGKMNVLDDLGKHREAIEIGQSMLVELTEHGDDDEVTWMRAAASENVGVALGYVGRHADALDAYRVAVDAYRQLDLPDDLARVTANEGVEFVESARPDDAIKALSAASEHFDEVGDLIWEGKCRTYMAQAWITAGGYLNAFTCLDQAHELLGSTDAETSELLRTQRVRADCLAALHLDADALDLYESIRPAMTEHGLVHDGACVDLGRGRLLGRAGLGTEAVDAVRSAIELFQRVGDDAGAAAGHLLMVDATEDAEFHVEEALRLLATTERPSELAAVLLTAATVLSRSDPARASEALDRAGTIVEQLGVPQLTLDYHRVAGQLKRLDGDRLAARRHLTTAVTISDDIKASLFTGGVRHQTHDVLASPVEDLVGLLVDRGENVEALRYSDAARTHPYTRSFRRDAVDSIPNELDALRSTYDRLLTASGPQVHVLTAQARRLERSANAPNDEPQTWNPPEPTAVTVPPDSVVYATVADEVIAFVRAGDGVRVERKVCAISDVEALVDELSTHWRRFEHPQLVERHLDSLVRATNMSLFRLYQRLIEPVFANRGIPRRLTVIADGAIGAVPFSALHDGTAHLIDHCVVRQTPSLGVDEALRRRRRAVGSVLALGVADVRAPNVDHEIHAVGGLWTLSVAATGGDATWRRLVDQGPDHDVIHLAGHGVLRADAPAFSAVRLADRWVTAAEMERLHLDGQVVILNTCESGGRPALGHPRRPLGFPRALLSAGASAVVANLWPTFDGSASATMISLHSAMASGHSVADALRTAQLETRARFGHPYYWAAPAAIGAAE